MASAHSAMTQRAGRQTNCWIVFYYASPRHDGAWTFWNQHFHTFVIEGPLPSKGDIQRQIFAAQKPVYVHNAANIEITGITPMPSRAEVDNFLAQTGQDGEAAPMIHGQPGDCILL